MPGRLSIIPVASPLDSTIFDLYIPKRGKKHTLLTLCHTWDLNLQCSNTESIGRVATPGSDYWMT